jgi:uncharacterized membrane protein YedE/YeeE|tara:strand:+ start:3048 stop:3461 length:414 start_codon:yes stop_codon:yes gene_type:complete
MKFLKFLVLGIIFGIIMSKAEIISWYRIYEMFSFESFHMYGVIGSALALGLLSVQIIKFFNLKSFDGNKIILNPKDKGIARYIIGGFIFGLGWSMTGACPGPLFVLLGKGVWPIMLIILGSVFGTFLYGLLKDKLPH